MQAAEFIRLAVEDLQSGFRAEAGSLSREQLLFRPTPGANSALFLLWHANRNEDEVFHVRIKGEPSVWQREGWDKRFGLEAAETGQGFDSDRVGRFQPEAADVVAYCERVWEAVPAGIGALSDTDLERMPNPQRPEWTVGRQLANFLLGHGFWHLGDIRFLKGLQGMPFGR